MNSQISQQYGFGASMETSVLFHAMKIFVRGIAYEMPATNKKGASKSKCDINSL